MPSPSPWRWLRRLVVLVLSLAVLALALALQTAAELPAPTVLPAQAGTPWAHAQRWWEQLQAQRQRAGARPGLWLAQDDLNALAAQWSAAEGGRVRARLGLVTDFAQLQASVRLGRAPLWLNLAVQFDMAEVRPGRWPRIVATRVGRLPLPPSWVEAAVEATLRHHLGPEWPRLTSTVTAWEARPGRLWLAWSRERAHWPQLAQAAGALLNPTERQALAAHGQAWQAALTAAGPEHIWTVPEALQTLARPALARVTRGESTAEAELRALLLHLALQAVGRSSAPLAGPPSPTPEGFGRLQMAGRDDMAQHFLVSAWLSWQGSAPLARTLGLGKELSDARGGSGFSFNDLAADEAGSQLGQQAAARPGALLAALATGVQEAMVFPPVDDLPEFMPEAEFQRRFGGVGAPAYEAERRQIRARIAALPLYQALAR